MSPSKVHVKTLEADKFAKDLTRQRDKAHAALKLAKAQMTTGQPDYLWRNFKIGDKVWVLAKNMKLKETAPKLTNQRLGPFPIKQKLSDWVYKVKLLETLKIHPIFYVGLLTHAIKDKHRPFLECPTPKVIGNEEEYEVEAIVSHRVEEGKWLYYIKWKGYRPKPNTWEPKDNLANTGRILKKYHQKILLKAHDSAKGP